MANDLGPSSVAPAVGLSASYSATGATLSGQGFELGVGSVSVGAVGDLVSEAGSLLRTAGGAVYSAGGFAETFQAQGTGVEQSFQVATAPAAGGDLLVDVPISGLTATVDDGAVGLVNTAGQLEATYSDLAVTDATGASVPASMAPIPGGAGIEISVDTSAATFPLSVDPVFEQVSEVHSSDGAASDGFGYSVATSGTLAVVGAPYHSVSGHTNQGAAYIFTLSGGAWTQTAELTASDGAAGDEFGTSVSISGSRVIVGAPLHSVSGHANQGDAYIYTLSGSTWTQTAELTATGGAAGDTFGSSVSISGSAVIVGADFHTVSGHADQGEAYIFALSGSTWSQTAALTAADGAADDLYGSSVSISGSVALVGAPDHAVSGRSDQGAAYLYTLSGGTWGLTKELSSSDGAAADSFGGSVSISGTTAVVGADTHKTGGLTGSGAAYVFVLSGGVWSQQAELSASDAAGNDLFGASVSIAGTVVLVGAQYHQVDGHADQGAAYEFALSGTTWSQIGELTASDGIANDYFGDAVAVSGTTALVGADDHTVSGHAAQGDAYFYATSPQTAETTSSDGAANDKFGYAVSVSGSTAVVAAPDHTVSGTAGVGAVYVFSYSGGTWTQAQELTPPSGTASENFGWSVAISGGYLAVGAPGYSAGGHTSLGAVYVYSLAAGTWMLAQTLTAADGAAGDELGWSVADSDGTIAAGAPLHTVSGHTDAGAAYIFAPNAAGVWSQTAELTAPDAAASDVFGYSVGLSANTVIVGAPDHAVAGHADQGAAYLYTSTGGTWTDSSPTCTADSVAELCATDGAANDKLGFSVAISNATAVVGAPGHAVAGAASQGAGYIYTYTSTAGWSQTAELVASDGAAGDELGYAASLAGQTAILGAPAHAVSGNSQQGAAYIYDQDGAAWPQAGELVSADGAAGDTDGDSVAISGTAVLTGAPDHTESSKADQGDSYFYSTGLVQAQGAAPGLDLVGNGSPSEACFECTAETSPTGAGTPGASTTSTGGTASTSGAPSVDPATGSMSLSVTDLSVPGPGIPLAFTRTYDDLGSAFDIAYSEATPPLGYGWSDNLGVSLTYTASAVTLTEENGAQLSFVPNTTSPSPYAWCPTAAAGSWCPTAPRVAATLSEGTGSRPVWTFTRSTGDQYSYTLVSTTASSAVLAAITDPDGDILASAAYSPATGQQACPAGDTCTAWTSNRSGRQLVIATNSAGQLVSVFDPSTTLAMRYSYTGSGCSTWASGKPADLCQATQYNSATGATALTSAYTYNSSSSTAAYDYLMVTSTVPGQSSATVDAYNSTGGLASQTDPQGDQTTYSYTGTDNSYLGGTTVITAPPGTGGLQDVTVDDFSNDVLTEQTNAWGTTAAAPVSYINDPVSLQPVQSIDGDGDVTDYTYQTYNQAAPAAPGTPVSSNNVLLSVDGLGNTTENAYNADNEIWCSVDAADYLNGRRCPTGAGTPITTPPAAGSDPYPGVTLTYYNSANEQVGTTDPLGNTTIFAYTTTSSGVPAGLPYCGVDPVDYANGVTCPAYGAAHVTGTATLTYDTNGDQTAVTNADGDTTSYCYYYQNGSGQCAAGATATGDGGNPEALYSSTDPDGTVTTFTYNTMGEPLTQTETFGSYSATTLNAYTSLGLKYCTISALAYSQGHTACPSAAPGSPPSAGSDPWPGATITIFNADQQAIDTVNPLGGVTQSAYDPAGNTYCTVSAYEYAAGVTCPAAEPTTAPTIGSDPYLGATIDTYNTSGEQTQTTNPLGSVTLDSYDPDGNVAQSTVESNSPTADPNVVTDYFYDADGNQTASTVDPGSSLAQTTLDSFDPDGNQYCTVSAKVYATGSFQCPTWQPSWIANPPSPASLYSTNPTTAQAENVTTSFYDANGDQLQTTNPDIDTTVTAYDADSRTYCSADPTNVAAWLSANPAGRYPYLCPTTPPTAAPTGTTTGYVTTLFDPAGQTLSSTDQVGDTTSYTYTPGGQTLTTTDPRGEVTTNCYYYQNATSSQCAYAATVGGGSADDLYSTTTPPTQADPSGETTTSTYYPGDQPDLTTTPAGTTTDTYDPDGDLTGVGYSNAAAGYATPANLSYTYNQDGSKASMTDASGTTAYNYDANGDVTGQALTAIGSLSNRTVGYSYYTTGALKAVAYPAYGSYTAPTATYTYDPTGYMASETDWLGDEVTFGHDPDDNLTGQDNNVNAANPTGTSSTAYSYDAADYNTAATSALAQTCGGSESLTQAFSGAGGSRNPDGYVTQDQETYSGSCSNQGGYQRDYSYDPAGRVIYQGSAPQGSNPNNFAYDASGDPTTISRHDTSGNFDTYNQTFDAAGEVAGQTPVAGSHGSTASYTYDSIGDQTDAIAGNNTLDYNLAAQLTSASVVGGTTTNYIYDANGLEAAATAVSSAGTTISQFTWDNTTASLPIILTDSTNDYLYGPSTTPVEQINLSTSTPTYMSYTAADSSWITTNQAGDETGFWRYDAFGNLAYGTPASPFGYSGQYTDATTGFINDRARWYAAQTGLFTTRDPDFATTDTAYTYALDNPVNVVDPGGNIPRFKPILILTTDQAQLDGGLLQLGQLGATYFSPLLSVLHPFYANVAMQLIEHYAQIIGVKFSACAAGEPVLGHCTLYIVYDTGLFRLKHSTSRIPHFDRSAADFIYDVCPSDAKGTCFRDDQNSQGPPDPRPEGPPNEDNPEPTGNAGAQGSEPSGDYGAGGGAAAADGADGLGDAAEGESAFEELVDLFGLSFLLD